MTYNQKTIDAPSYTNQFGWEKISEDEAIPVIIRSNNIRYSPVRIVEQEIIKKFDTLPQTVFQCITLKSFYLTSIEAKLLNNINFNHCNNRYGEEFFGAKDVIISAADVKELERYLRISSEIFSHDLLKNSQSLGIVKMTPDPHNLNSTLLAPYLVKQVTPPSTTTQAKFIPMKLIAHFEVYATSAFRTMPNDWDVMYLKMLAIYCENNSQSYISPDNDLISLDGLAYSKTNTPVIYDIHTTANNWQVG